MTKIISSEPVNASSFTSYCLKCYATNRDGFQLIYSGIHENTHDAIKEAHEVWKRISSRYTSLQYKVLIKDTCIASGMLNYTHSKISNHENQSDKKEIHSKHR